MEQSSGAEKMPFIRRIWQNVVFPYLSYGTMTSGHGHAQVSYGSDYERLRQQCNLPEVSSSQPKYYATLSEYQVPLPMFQDSFVSDQAIRQLIDKTINPE